MIEATLSPSCFPAQQDTELTLEVRNVGDGPCKRVKLRLEQPRGLRVVGGSLQVESELLAPGQRATRCFTVRAVASGRVEISTANYSFRDARGRPRHPDGPRWVLEVCPAVAARPPDRPGAPEIVRTKVFISYRWSDSQDRAYLLHGELRRAFGEEHVHLDQEGARLGGDFQARLVDGLRVSSAMLVLIGPAWNPEIQGTGRRRLDNEDDPIRCEVDAALRTGMYLIPVMSVGIPVPVAVDLPECLRPLLRAEIAWIHPSSVTASLKRIVDDLRPYVAGGRFR